MSIFLDEAEVTKLKDKCYAADRYGECFHFDKFARAIQLALIEKLRKAPVGFYDMELDIAYSSSEVDTETELAEDDFKPLYILPTPQELENES